MFETNTVHKCHRAPCEMRTAILRVSLPACSDNWTKFGSHACLRQSRNRPAHLAPFCASLHILLIPVCRAAANDCHIAKEAIPLTCRNYHCVIETRRCISSSLVESPRLVASAFRRVATHVSFHRASLTASSSYLVLRGAAPTKRVTSVLFLTGGASAARQCERLPDKEWAAVVDLYIIRRLYFPQGKYSI